MTVIARVKLEWTGFNGGPGYSIFHMRDFGLQDVGDWTNEHAAAAATKIEAWADGVRSIVAPPVRLKVSSDVEIINEQTGQLETVVSAGVRNQMQNPAPGVGGYSGASGAVVTWRTNGVRNGRRIRGRTFIVPCYAAAFQEDGTLSPAARLQLEASSANLISAEGTPDMGVYARPTRTRNPDGSFTTNADGVWYFATSVSVPDLAAVMRSRRD
jgi:hypothetical protein